MQTAHEPFVRQLGDMLDAEKKLVEALGEQQESSRPELQKAFGAHRGSNRETSSAAAPGV